MSREIPPGAVFATSARLDPAGAAVISPTDQWTITGGMERTPVSCPWHPLPDNAIVQLVAIERRAVRRHRIGPPIEPARVVWGVWIQRDGTTHESYDLPLDVIRTLARDGGPIRPMIEITALRLNAAVERAAGGRPARAAGTCGPGAQEQQAAASLLCTRSHPVDRLGGAEPA